MMENKTAELMALLYVAGETGLEQADLCNLLEISQAAMRELAQHLQTKFAADQESGLQIINLNGKYKLTTAPAASSVIERYFAKDLSKNLSQSSLEVLSIVAYRQPITRLEIDDIRGVNSTGALQTLIWRGLVKVSGKKDVPGHPNLYVTTDYFLQYFNYESLADLPVIENFEDDSFDENGQVDLFKANGQIDSQLSLEQGDRE